MFAIANSWQEILAFLSNVHVFPSTITVRPSKPSFVCSLIKQFPGKKINFASHAWAKGDPQELTET